MTSILAYVRNLLGWSNDEPTAGLCFKRDRTDEDSLDDDVPAFKRLRTLGKSSFPDIMASNDNWERRKKKSPNVRYVPIQIDPGHPSTSTPNNLESRGNRGRNLPIRLVDVTENGDDSFVSRSRVSSPIRPVIHAVVDDDDDEVTYIENKSNRLRKNCPQMYVNLDDEDENDNGTDDVIYIRKIAPPPPVKPFKFFVTKNNRDDPSIDPKSTQYYQVINNRRQLNSSPKTYSKFKTPAGISKGYKKTPTVGAKWMQPSRTSNLLTSRNKYSELNGNIKSAILESFDLEEKRNYQELIARSLAPMKQFNVNKPLEVINIADDSASFRTTKISQKNALNQIKLVERGLNAEKDFEATKEYDPITVASINSSDSEVEAIPSESSTSSVKIDPINSLRDSFKDCAITSNDWLAKIHNKYRKRDLETQEKLKDATRESAIISKVNHEQKLAHLEHKLKYELAIPESLIEEAQPALELPALTPEQEMLVKKALGPGPPGQLLVEKFNLRIHRRDLQTLAGLNWLNDEVINFYMNLLMQRSQERSDLPKVYATNTFFYPKLMQAGQAGLRRWTRKVDIFAHDLLVIPVHLGVHWCLSLVDFRAKRVMYLDSMGGRNQPCLDALMKYLRDEHQDKKGQPFDDKGWKAVCLSKEIPQQMNGSDCGMFACTFGEFAARAQPFAFTQEHMPYLRRKAALEILRGKLLL